MKQYTGTKTVKAEPMSMGEAFAKKLLKKDIKLSDVKKWKAGYLVEYEGGYQSWSPADVFEKSYKLSETYLDRLKTEYDEIAERLEKLQDYLNKIYKNIIKLHRMFLFLNINNGLLLHSVTFK